MTEQELRMLVREAIAQQTAPAAVRATASGSSFAVRQHVSHALFVLPAGADTDGPCLIEPAVPCNHCGYCKSLGH
jgi:hypothetical protein